MSVGGTLLSEQFVAHVPRAATAANVSGSVTLTGSNALVIGQTTGTTCTAEGSLIYDPDLDAVKVCVGLAWQEIGSGGSSTLGDVGNPALSCSDIKDNRIGATDAAYFVRPAGAATTYQVWCEMDIALGGWTLVGAFNPYPQASYSTATCMDSVATGTFPTTENPGNVFVNAATQGAYPHSQVLILGGDGAYIRLDKTIAFWTASFLNTGGTYPSNTDFPVVEASWSNPSGLAHAWWCGTVGCNENINTALADGGSSGCSYTRIHIDSACSGTAVTRLYIR